MGLLLGLLWVDRRLRRGGALRFSGVNFAASTGAGLVLSPSLWLWLLVLLMVGVGYRFDLACGYHCGCLALEVWVCCQQSTTGCGVELVVGLLLLVSGWWDCCSV